MDNGQEIAVKKLIDMPLDHDSEKKFHDECINLLRVKHKNIVRLVGYCDETHRQCVEHEGKHVFADKNERALCFEHLQGGSLDRHVSEDPCRLDWDICYAIIKGVCEGLNHLYKNSIFHLDIKPANILLDKRMTPKIGDFGLSRLFSSTKTCTTTTPLGTPGYTPPEYVDKQEISPKYDVFSLGVLIIHIMAGREQYNDHVNDPSKIIDLVCENWGKRLDATMWSRASQEVNTCIEIALRCVKHDRPERPTIINIVDDLNRIDNRNLPFIHEATNLQNGEGLVYNQYTKSFSIGVHDNATRFESMEGIDYKPEVRGNDRLMYEPTDSVDDSNKSIMRLPYYVYCFPFKEDAHIAWFLLIIKLSFEYFTDQVSHAIGGHASRAISESPDVTQTTEVDIDGHHRWNPHISRAEGDIHTPVTIDTIGNLFQWARSTISSQWRGTQEKKLHDELFFLESSLQNLMDTLPAMYDLIDLAEWRSHKHCVAEYLAKLKDTVYDADDLLDEFRWYMLKVKVEGNGCQSPPVDFFNGVILGSFTKLVNAIQDRMDNISTHLRNMGLHDVTARFDKSIRPETSSFPNETKIYGRDMELNYIIEWLYEHTNSRDVGPKCKEGNSAVDVSTSTSTYNQVGKEKRIECLPVLPIVGIGGIGKTTLAQHICSHTDVQSHFGIVIWICVSDDFDVKRLTKEAIESCPGKQARGKKLNSLQNDLSEIVK